MHRDQNYVHTTKRATQNLISTHNKCKQVRSQSEKDKFAGEEEEEEAEDILSLGFLSPTDIVLSDESIHKKLLGFLPCGFPG